MQHYIRGAQLYRSGQKDQAIQELEQAVAAKPDLRMARSLLGDAYRAKGDYQHAAVHYEAASKLDPYTLSNHYNLGLVYQLLNRLEEAASAYLRALKLDPRDVKSNMNLGLVYLAMGKIDQSVDYLQRAARLDPDNAMAWSNLGVALDASGKLQQAESCYRKALELDSRSVVTQQNLAQNLMSQNKLPEALTMWQQALSQTDSPSMRKRYGDALALAGQFDQALAQYDLALKADGKYLPAINEKASLLIRRYVDGLELDDQLRFAALDLWRSSLKINPNQPQVAEAIAKWEKPSLFGN